MSRNYNLAENRTEQTRQRNSQRRWDILCKKGVLTTHTITYASAVNVAQWCDKNHPDCKPHIIQED